VERSPVIRLAGIAIVFLSIVIGSWILFGPGSVTHVEISEKDFHRFSGVMGPSHISVVEPAVPANWTTYSHGTTSRPAIVLTDQDSRWLGLAHGLKSIGIPFKITRDMQETLTLEVPEGWTLDRGRSYPVPIDQAGRFVILQEAVGAMALRFLPSQTGAPRKRGA
jgi:hypothetical protein